MMGNEERLTLTIVEVSKAIGISRSTAYSLATQGVIPTIRLGRRLVVPKVALEAMLANAGKSNAQT